MALLLAAPGVALSVDTSTCPDRAAVSSALLALGVRTLPEGAHAPARADIEQRAEGLTVTLRDGRRRELRVVPASGSCDERAATLAAIIERFARPVLLEPSRHRDAGIADGGGEPFEPDGGEPEPFDAGEPPDAGPAPDAGVTAPDAGVPAPSLHAGAIVRITGIGWAGGLRGLFELGGHLGNRSFRGELSAGWATPLSATVGSSTVSTQEARLALRGAYTFAFFPLRAELLGVAQLLWATATVSGAPQSAFRVNAALGAGLGVAPRLGPVELELMLRALAYLTAQSFDVTGTPLLVTPRWEAHLSVGVGL